MDYSRKYACHRVYEAGKILSTRSVVSIDKSGKVSGCSPLMEETAATEWIGGIIVLSDKAQISAVADFRSLLDSLTGSSSGGCSYAWHIVPFDFAKEELTAQSVIRRL